MGLCFSFDFLVAGVSRTVGRGEPMTFLAADFTAVAARKAFFFFRLGMPNLMEMPH